MKIISVVIPTYKRPKCLGRCLNGLKKQTRLPNEVLVVTEKDDKETQIYIKKNNIKSLKIKNVKINGKGQVPKLNRGLEKSKGDIISFIDDDAAPHRDWLEKIEKKILENPKIGGVGGRDYLFVNGKLITGKTKNVGKVSWYGIKGGHHLKSKTQSVDTLKGTNMSFRRESIDKIRFDKRLKGNGAQVRNDTAFCLRLKKNGWKLLYDPSIAVDHHMAVRYEDDKRGNYNWTAVEEGAYNETLVMLEYLKPISKIAYLFFVLGIGNIFTPGIFQCSRIISREKFDAILRLFATYKGRFEGWKAYRKWKNQ